MIVGRDPRFLGETFCSMAAEILSAQGITPLVVPEPAPTPAFAYAVIRQQSRRRHQFHCFAQSTGIQRHQVLYARWVPCAARSNEED